MIDELDLTDGLDLLRRYAERGTPRPMPSVADLALADPVVAAEPVVPTEPATPVSADPVVAAEVGHVAELAPAEPTTTTDSTRSRHRAAVLAIAAAVALVAGVAGLVVVRDRSSGSTVDLGPAQSGPGTAPPTSPTPTSTPTTTETVVLPPGSTLPPTEAERAEALNKLAASIIGPMLTEGGWMPYSGSSITNPQDTSRKGYLHYGENAEPGKAPIYDAPNGTVIGYAYSRLGFVTLAEDVGFDAHAEQMRRFGCDQTDSSPDAVPCVPPEMPPTPTVDLLVATTARLFPDVSIDRRTMSEPDDGRPAFVRVTDDQLEITLEVDRTPEPGDPIAAAPAGVIVVAGTSARVVAVAPSGTLLSLTVRGPDGQPAPDLAALLGPSRPTDPTWARNPTELTVALLTVIAEVDTIP